MNSVSPEYDRDLLISIMELASTHKINKRAALAALRNASLDPIAKVFTGKKGAPTKLYMTETAKNAIEEYKITQELLNVRRKSLSFLLSDSDKFEE